MEKNQKGPVKLITTRSEEWQEQLSNPIRQSIEYFSNPKNLSAYKPSQISRWVVAGTSEQNIKRFEKLASRSGLQIQNDRLSHEGYGISDLQLKSFETGSPGSFRRLKRQAERLDLALWQEVIEKNIGNGPINTASITEGTFDDNLTDASLATDVNGDGTPDPLWHLLPSDPGNAQFGVNATGAWNSVSGDGVNVGVLDTYFDINHGDLNPGLPVNFDWNGDGTNDGPDLDGNGIADIWDAENVTNTTQSHGTAVAGIALGRIDGQSSIGVAPESAFMPNGFLNHQSLWPSSDFYGMADVVNNSWGSSQAEQGLLRTASPTTLANWQVALDGAIQVKSAGNSRGNSTDPGAGWDNSNNSRYANRETLMVAATMANGEVEEYSTPGANVFVAAPVNGSNVRWSSSTPTNQLTTTSDVSDVAGNAADNRGYADGTIATRFSGTSAAAPMVSGSIALMLEANPTLTLRDVQHILVESSIKNGLFDSDGDGALDAINPNAGGNAINPGSAASASTLELRTSLNTATSTSAGVVDGHNTGWFENGAGHWVSDSFGFGIVDAGEAVNLASTWANVSDELHTGTQEILTTPYVIPEGALGGLNSLNRAGGWKVNSHLTVEWVELTLDLNLPEQDEVMLAVESPSGTRSVLMAPGGSDSSAYSGERTLISNQFWGESANGDWSVEVLDVNNDGDSATIANAKLDIFGTCNQTSPLQVTTFNQLNSSGFGPDAMARKFLFDGGAMPGSYNLLSVTPYGDGDAFGLFSKGIATGLKIDEGTLFTTGQAKDAIGPNSAPNTTTNWGLPGHPLLGTNSKDLSGLEIRFSPNQDMELDWKAQFGSEEFDEWSPSVFDDKAAIFLGRTRRNPKTPLRHLSPQNLLKGPGGGDVSVNGFSQDKGVFRKHMAMNEPCGPLSWEYDGTTQQAWTSKKAVLNKGEVYVLAPMIADRQDHIYDSGVIFGPSKPMLTKFGTITEIPRDMIIKPEGLDDLDLERLTRKETRQLAWTSVDPADLSEEPIEAIRRDDVDRKRSSGKRSFNDDNVNNVDWNRIIQSDEFSEMAAEPLRTNMLPRRSLNDASFEKLLDLGASLEPDMEKLLSM